MLVVLARRVWGKKSYSVEVQYSEASVGSYIRNGEITTKESEPTIFGGLAVHHFINHFCSLLTC